MTLRLDNDIHCQGCKTRVTPIVVNKVYTLTTMLVRCPACGKTVEIGRDADSH